MGFRRCELAPPPQIAPFAAMRMAPRTDLLVAIGRG